MDVQKNSVLFWWGFQSVCLLPRMGAAVAGKGPQDLRACRRSVHCARNKRETERSVTASGSHAPGLLEMFSQPENWRQMEASCFGSLAPSSLLLKCYSKPMNPEELQEKEWKENKLRLRHSAQRKAFVSWPRLLPHRLSCSINQSISQSTNTEWSSTTKGLWWALVGGTGQNAKQRLHP